MLYLDLGFSVNWSVLVLIRYDHGTLVGYEIVQT